MLDHKHPKPASSTPDAAEHVHKTVPDTDQPTPGCTRASYDNFACTHPRLSISVETSKPRAARSLKSTDRLNAGAVEGLFLSARFAYRLNRPLNVALTLSWTALKNSGSDRVFEGRSNHEAGEHLRGRFARKWPDACWIWVREIGPQFGEHIHFAIHLKDDQLRAFQRFLATELRDELLTPQDARLKMRHWTAGPEDSGLPSDILKRFGVRDLLFHSPSGAVHATRIDHGWRGLQGWLGYLAKGLWQGQGEILGKRSGTSRNLGVTAQANASWCEDVAFFIERAIPGWRQASPKPLEFKASEVGRLGPDDHLKRQLSNRRVLIRRHKNFALLKTDDGWPILARLIWTGQHLGGQRAWFLCPSCQSKSTKLILFDQFGCATCKGVREKRS